MGSYQSYPWNGKASCWFDSSLEALFSCYLHSPEMFEDAFETLSKQTPGSDLNFPSLETIPHHMISWLSSYRVHEITSELQTEISKMRNDLAVLLNLDIDQEASPLVCTQIDSHLIMTLGLDRKHIQGNSNYIYTNRVLSFTRNNEVTDLL